MIGSDWMREVFVMMGWFVFAIDLGRGDREEGCMLMRCYVISRKDGKG
jgi:hypothetical protein